MGTISRRTLLGGLAGGSAASAGAAHATAHVPQATTVSARVAWFDRGLVKLKLNDSGATDMLVEMQQPFEAPSDAEPRLRPASRVRIVLSAPTDGGALVPCEVHAILDEEGARVPLQARLVSLSWECQDRTEAILRVVAAHFGVSAAAIRSQRRSRPIVLARQTAMHLMHKLTRLSFREIGRCLGHRSPMIVLYAIRHIEILATQDARVRKDVAMLREQVARFA